MATKKKHLKTRWQNIYREKPASNLDLFRWWWILWIRSTMGWKSPFWTKPNLGEYVWITFSNHLTFAKSKFKKKNPPQQKTSNLKLHDPVEVLHPLRRPSRCCSKVLRRVWWTMWYPDLIGGGMISGAAEMSLYWYPSIRSRFPQSDCTQKSDPWDVLYVYTNQNQQNPFTDRKNCIPVDPSCWVGMRFPNFRKSLP